MAQLLDCNAIINNHRLAYGVHGSGEPIVFVHRTPSMSYIWRNVVPEVVAASYQADVFDLLGYGQSERPWDPEVDTSMTGNDTVLRQL